MVHGDCSSRGCYAMTDEQIAEIYALARESFFGGQQAFQIQAYPFRMTPQNMAKHRNNPHIAFWKMLKQGYDHFEVTRQEPKVDVCEQALRVQRRAAESARPLSFERGRPARPTGQPETSPPPCARSSATTRRRSPSWSRAARRPSPVAHRRAMAACTRPSSPAVDRSNRA